MPPCRLALPPSLSQLICPHCCFPSNAPLNKEFLSALATPNIQGTQAKTNGKDYIQCSSPTPFRSILVLGRNPYSMKQA